MLFRSVMTFLIYRSNRQSIREKEIEYAKKGKDTTIDSLNEAKEILSELNEEIKGSFRNVPVMQICGCQRT